MTWSAARAVRIRTVWIRNASLPSPPSSHRTRGELHRVTRGKSADDPESSITRRDAPAASGSRSSWRFCRTRHARRRRAAAISCGSIRARRSATGASLNITPIASVAVLAVRAAARGRTRRSGCRGTGRRCNGRAAGDASAGRGAKAVGPCIEKRGYTPRDAALHGIAAARAAGPATPCDPRKTRAGRRARRGEGAVRCISGAAGTKILPRRVRLPRPIHPGGNEP
jgi:hypothetical protein